MPDVELHEEIGAWMASLDDDDWGRTAVVIDRLRSGERSNIIEEPW
jgi:hypothetical protein